MRILVITDSLPYPLYSGDRLRVYNLLRRMAGEHEVSLAVLDETPEESGPSIAHLQGFLKHVVTVPEIRRSKLAYLPGLLGFALKGIPLELYFKYTEALVQRIADLVRQEQFDIIHFENSHMGLYVEHLPPEDRSKHVLVYENASFEQHARIAQNEPLSLRKLRSWLYSVMLRRWEPQHGLMFDRCVAVSEVDRALLLAENPRLQIDIVPNGVDTTLYQPLPLTATDPAVLFVGKMSYRPTTDAAVYLGEQLFPALQERIPGLELWLVGREPAPEVRRLERPSIHVTGQVESVVPYYARSRVALVPLRSGGGTRLKILEALALGRPVVSTTVGAEGLDVTDGEHILIADHPDDFIEKTYRLMTDDALWARLVANGRTLVEQRYSWDSLAEQLLSIYSELAAD
ncbi:MAG: glycosyltransferase [Anaerolineae bacterium]|nr:glycosyltransferase [Anaerolineae bacterium]